MTALAEMTRSDVYYWLQEHALRISVARDEWLEATRKYANAINASKGGFEHDRTTAASFVEDVSDRADALLAEELKRDLGL